MIKLKAVSTYRWIRPGYDINNALSIPVFPVKRSDGLDYIYYSKIENLL